MLSHTTSQAAARARGLRTWQQINLCVGWMPNPQINNKAACSFIYRHGLLIIKRHCPGGLLARKYRDVCLPTPYPITLFPSRQTEVGWLDMKTSLPFYISLSQFRLLKTSVRQCGKTKTSYLLIEGTFFMKRNVGIRPFASGVCCGLTTKNITHYTGYSLATRLCYDFTLLYIEACTCTR